MILVAVIKEYTVINIAILFHSPHQSLEPIVRLKFQRKINIHD